jgi:hypothetical protein
LLPPTLIKQEGEIIKILKRVRTGMYERSVKWEKRKKIM